MSPPAEKLKAACKIAGVEPTTRELNSEDPKAFVISANIHRRHMTKGQRAMAVAMIYPEPKRGTHSELTKSTGGLGEKVAESRAKSERNTKG